MLKNIFNIVIGLIFICTTLFSQTNVWLIQGKKLMESGDFPGAISSFTKVIDHDQNNFDAYYNRGMSYLFQKKYAAAFGDLSRAIDINRESPDVYNARGLAAGYLGKVDDAVNDFSQAIELDHRFSQAYINRGSAYITALKYKKALEDFTNAIKYDPNNPSSYFQRGRLYVRQKQLQKSVNDFTKAVQLGLNDPTVYYNRGNSYYKMKNYKKAIADYSRVLAVNPDDTEALNNRAMSYELSGNKKKADIDRKKLNKIAGNRFPPIEEIKFKTFTSQSGSISVDLPASWHVTYTETEDESGMIISIEKVKTESDQMTVGVTMSLQKNMGKRYGVKTEQDIMEFWKSSILTNAEDYFRYQMFKTKSSVRGGWGSTLNTTLLQFSEEYYPFKMYEQILVKPNTLFYAYYQSPERQWGYYKKFFDKAIKSLRIN